MRRVWYSTVSVLLLSVGACGGESSVAEPRQVTSTLASEQPTAITAAGKARRMTPAEEKAMNDEIAAQRRANANKTFQELIQEPAR